MRPSSRVDLATGHISAVAYSVNPSWVHESPFLTVGWQDTNDSGAASLQHMAMRQALADQRCLTPDVLACVPWRMARYLWECLGKRYSTVSLVSVLLGWAMLQMATYCVMGVYPYAVDHHEVTGRCLRSVYCTRRGLDIRISEQQLTRRRTSRKQTLYMWKLLATAYPAEFQRLSPYHAFRVEGLRMPVADYLNLVKSESLSWAVTLAAATHLALAPELVAIATVPNLVALELSAAVIGAAANASSSTAGASRATLLDGLRGGAADDERPVMPSLSNRVVRTWSELADGSPAAFAHLRLLRLVDQQELSSDVFRYLERFPSLRVVVVHGCLGRLSLANKLALAGWRVRQGPFSQLAADWGRGLSLYECYQHCLETDSHRARDCRDCDQKGQRIQAFPGPSTPVLDFQIGPLNADTKSDLRQPTFTTAATTATTTTTRTATTIVLDRSSWMGAAVPAAQCKRMRGDERRIPGDREKRIRAEKPQIRRGRARDLGHVLAELSAPSKPLDGRQTSKSASLF